MLVVIGFYNILIKDMEELIIKYIYKQDFRVYLGTISTITSISKYLLTYILK